MKKLSLLLLMLIVATIVSVPMTANGQVTHTINVYIWNTGLQLWDLAPGVDCIFSIRTSNQNPEWQQTFPETNGNGVATCNLVPHSTSTYWTSVVDEPDGFHCVEGPNDADPADNWQDTNYGDFSVEYWLRPN